MMAALKHLSQDERKQVTLSYDNMCHVDNLRVAKKELPSPGMNNFNLYQFNSPSPHACRRFKAHMEGCDENH